MDDYYNILGLSPSASDDEIKKAYRRLAREHHPDKGGNTQTFQQVQKAYEALCKRKDNVPFGHHQPQQVRKASDHYYQCVISLDEAYTGILKKFKVKRRKPCVDCFVKCPHCRGEGQITHKLQTGLFTQIFNQPCSKCGMRGVLPNNKSCGKCVSGYFEEEKVVEINIPAGADTRNEWMIEGWGEQTHSSVGLSGDLHVKLIVKEHSIFKREGADLIQIVKVSLRESLIGKKITIPHFGGAFELDIGGFGIINPNKVYTVFDKGMMGGHLHIRFVIDYPETTLSTNDKNILEKTLNALHLD
jgi:DnaJ-class molecular chaperone